MSAWEVMAVLFVIAMVGSAVYLAFWFEQERKDEDDG